MEVWAIGARGRLRSDLRAPDPNLRPGLLGLWYPPDLPGESIPRPPITAAPQIAHSGMPVKRQEFLCWAEHRLHPAPLRADTLHSSRRVAHGCDRSMIVNHMDFFWPVPFVVNQFFPLNNYAHIILYDETYSSPTLILYTPSSESIARLVRSFLDYSMHFHAYGSLFDFSQMGAYVLPYLPHSFY